MVSGIMSHLLAQLFWRMESVSTPSPFRAPPPIAAPFIARGSYLHVGLVGVLSHSDSYDRITTLPLYIFE